MKTNRPIVNILTARLYCLLSIRLGHESASKREDVSIDRSIDFIICQ